jgi:hypothetical protein
MKTIITILILTLLTAPADKNLKRILKDGQFSKLPTNAKTIRHEIIVDSKKRFGYLVFETSADDIAKWTKQSSLILTSKKEIFDSNLIVWPSNRPTWFKDSSDKFVTGDIYYSKRESDKFLSNSWVDINRKIIHLEYEIGL